MHMDAANNIRDARLRFQILRILANASANPLGVRGRKIVDWIEASNGADQFEDSGHAERLLMDLQDAGYIAIEDTRTDRVEAWGLDKIDCRIVDLGRRFMNRAVPADPMVDDGRILKRKS